MPQTRTAPTAWIHTKVCPCCGYRGVELQAVEETEVFECPVCANDLYARPPKSYFEMEGLALLNTPDAKTQHPASHRAEHEHRRRARGWFARLYAFIRRVLPTRG